MEKWTDDDRIKSTSQGWSLFHCCGSDDGDYQIQKLDEESNFPTDKDAWSFVVRQALNGDQTAQHALNDVKLLNPQEHLRVSACSREASQSACPQIF